MKLQVIGRNLQVSDDLRDYAERKLARLEKRLNPYSAVDLTLCVERNPRVTDNQVAEVSVQVRGEVLKVREAATDMRAAIDQAADCMLRAVNRHAEQHRRGRPHHSHDKHLDGEPTADVEQLAAEIAAAGQPAADPYAP